MKEITANARQGFMLAKSLRLMRLMTHECVSRLTENVTDIHTTLKTYMLKTCLFVLHQRLPDPTVELLPEQWVQLIFYQLLQFIVNGDMRTVFDAAVYDPSASLFYCKHNLKEIQEHDELRAACCDQRIDLLIIAEHLYKIMRRHCQMRHIPSVDDNLMILQPCEHNAGLVE